VGSRRLLPLILAVLALASTGVASASTLPSGHGALQASPARSDGYWLPNLKELLLFVPENPTEEEITAALSIAALAARKTESGRDILVRVQHPRHNDPSHPELNTTETRTVAIQRTVTARIEGGITTEGGSPSPLVIASPPGRLLGLVDELLKEADGHGAHVGDLPPEARWPLSRLWDSPPLRMTEDHGDLLWAFSQADLGGPVSAASLRLRGTYRSGAADADAALLVLMNGSLVQVIPLRESGLFDVQIAVQPLLLHRDNQLALRLVRAANSDARQGRIELLLAELSHLEVEWGQLLQAGFERFPQALLPQFQVALDSPSADALEGAAQLTALLQHATRRPLRPSAVRWEDALAGSGPILLVAHNPVSTDPLKPPLRTEPLRLVGRDGTELLRVSAGARFALLQAFDHGGRDVLLLTQRDYTPGLSHLPHQIALDGGWYNVQGQSWLQLADHPPFSIPIQEGTLRVRVEGFDRVPWWSSVRPIFYGFVAALIALALAWMYPKTVRKQMGQQP